MVFISLIPLEQKTNFNHIKNIFVVLCVVFWSFFVLFAPSSKENKLLKFN